LSYNDDKFMDVSLLRVAALFYLLATVGFVFYVLVRNTASRIPTVILLAGLVFHSGALGVHFLQEGYPAVTQFHEALTFKSWLIVALYLVIQIKYPLTVLGAIVAPVVFLMTLAAFAFGLETSELPAALKTYWVPVHFTVALLGNAVFALAFAVSLIYLLQERGLKHRKKTIGWFSRIPSLETLDRLNYQLLVWGFPLMTLGILTGSFLARMYWGDYWTWDPRQISSGIAWLFYGALLHGRITAGLRGKKAALLTMFGFCVVLGYFLWGDALFPSRHGGRFE
jgi:cytochrome c-type biogenesis protein CcsB